MKQKQLWIWLDDFYYLLHILSLHLTKVHEEDASCVDRAAVVVVIAVLLLLVFQSRHIRHQHHCALGDGELNNIRVAERMKRAAAEVNNMVAFPCLLHAVDILCCGVWFAIICVCVFLFMRRWCELWWASHKRLQTHDGSRQDCLIPRQNCTNFDCLNHGQQNQLSNFRRLFML